ncbi:iron-sulfur assembly protein IscA, chloroplastic [Rutidosis leptorrhynchoides]|uniref:iron-sulfur assembly protein IscA, chloroplastic n=1 Tax=Rutidosis leptorrhynchoides TaxID=125765 RepID=UPI003A999D13
MAFTMSCPSSLFPLRRFSNHSNSLSLSATNSIYLRFSNRNLLRPITLAVRSSSVPATAPPSEGLAPAISLTDDALKHLNKMRSDRNEDLCLRIGVKQGGCSGMSYTMEFENRANARPDDSFIEFNGCTIVCDPKSLLFIYGMQLDYSDALIGGGFAFKNPNATQTCGCGKSFAAEM